MHTGLRVAAENSSLSNIYVVYWVGAACVLGSTTPWYPQHKLLQLLFSLYNLSLYLCFFRV